MWQENKNVILKKEERNTRTNVIENIIADELKEKSVKILNAKSTVDYIYSKFAVTIISTRINVLDTSSLQETPTINKNSN